MKFSKNIILVFIIIFFVLITTVSAHDSDNPGVIIDTPSNNANVSGEVEINATVDDHYETQYVNFTVEGIDNQYSWKSQDTNPSNGWSTTWDTSNCSNGRYYIQSTAINNLGLTGEYIVFVTLSNVQKNVSLMVENITVAVNQSCNIVAKLVDNNSKGISNKNIEFIIDDAKYYAITNTGGIASVSFTPSRVEKYNVTSSFAGDNVYKSANNNSSIVSILNSINLDISFINAEYGEIINLTAVLTDRNNSILTNETVNFYVDGDFVGSAISNNNGIAVLNYLVSKKGGNYIYSASINKTDMHDELRVTNFLHVLQSEVYLTLTSDKSGVKVGDDVTITYNVINNGPDSAKNTIFRYTIPSDLKFIGANVDIGEYMYNSTSHEITWNLGSLPVGEYSLNLKMLAIGSARNNLTPFLSTDTYDESIINGVPTRYLTVEEKTVENVNLTNNYKTENYYLSYDNSNYYSDLSNNTLGNPILLLFMCLTIIFGFKIRR